MIYNGLTPCFADIDPVTNCLDPEKTEKSLTSRTRLLIPVHYAGAVCNMESFSEIARKHDLHVIEDAAHAIGSEYATGERVGCCKYSDMTIFSFHPVKTITCGEGGAVTTNDPELYERGEKLLSGCRHSGHNILNLCGKTTIFQLFTVIHEAELLISNDTGSAHIGALTGTRTVIICGKGDYGIFVPYGPELEGKQVFSIFSDMDCSGCHWRNPKEECRKAATYRCISGISVDNVWQILLQNCRKETGKCGKTVCSSDENRNEFLPSANSPHH